MWGSINNLDRSPLAWQHTFAKFVTSVSEIPTASIFKVKVKLFNPQDGDRTFLWNVDNPYETMLYHNPEIEIIKKTWKSEDQQNSV
jgi:hypothetical protein